MCRPNSVVSVDVYRPCVAATDALTGTNAGESTGRHLVQEGTCESKCTLLQMLQNTMLPFVLAGETWFQGSHTVSLCLVARQHFLFIMDYGDPDESDSH